MLQHKFWFMCRMTCSFILCKLKKTAWFIRNDDADQFLTFALIHWTTTDWFLSLTGPHCFRRLPSSFERVWTLTWVMGAIWKSSNTTRHLLVMNLTVLLQVPTGLWFLASFLFCRKPFSSLHSVLQEKCVDNCTFQCDVGVWIKEPSDSSRQWHVHLWRVKKINDCVKLQL